MTALPPNADELVSAYLDGEAAPDEVELVESNEELLARVASMRSVSERLGAPIAPPAELRELHLAAALAAFDDLVTGGHATAVAVAPTENDSRPDTGSQVASLAEARHRRRRRLNGLMAAAAAALLLFVGITALTVSRTNEGFDTADEAVQLKDGADEADTAGETFSADAAADDSANMTMAAPPEEEVAADDAAGAMMSEAAPAAEAAMADEAEDSEAGDSFATRSVSPTDEAIFVGSFPDSATLEDFLIGEYSVDELRERANDETTGPVPSCQAAVDEIANAPSSTLIGTAEIDGVFSEIHLVPDGQRLLIVEPLDCVVVGEIVLPAP